MRRAGAEVLARTSARASAAPDLIEKQFERSGLGGLAQRIAAVFRSRTRDEWRAFNDEHDAMIEPVLELDEALELRARPRARDGGRDGAAGARARSACSACRSSSRARPATPRARLRRSASTPRRCSREAGFAEDEVDGADRAGPRRARTPAAERREVHGMSVQQVNANGALEDLRAGRAVRGPGGDGTPLPPRGPPPGAGEDQPQHGLLPATGTPDLSANSEIFKSPFAFTCWTLIP